MTIASRDISSGKLFLKMQQSELSIFFALIAVRSLKNDENWQVPSKEGQFEVQVILNSGAKRSFIDTD